MPSPKTAAPSLDAPVEPYVVPEGIQLEHKFGAVTGKPMWRVLNFNMPYAGSPEEAVKLYHNLRQAFSSGYFTASSKRGTTAQ